MGKIIYIIAESPFSAGDAFVLTEMIALKDMGVDLLVVPRNNSGILFHKKAERLTENTLSLPVLDLRSLYETFRYMAAQPFTFLRILKSITLKARNIKIAVKNLTILPKGIYVSKYLRSVSACHIHAHWAATTATMAFIIHQITGIPWSFTAHRWDIPENNLLKEKCKTATFVRAIDQNGRYEMVEIVNDISLAEKIKVIHMGVDMPKHDNNSPYSCKVFTILCPANYVRKKGHRYLFEACRILSDKHIHYKCLIAGDGPMEKELRQMVRNLDLEDSIEHLGRLPHEKLFDLYKKREIDTVVLPSIITKDAEKEGIPVSLMEAMSYGIPVISTNTGGISELIGDGGGIMIDEKDPHAIADSIVKLIEDKQYFSHVSAKGRTAVEKNFNMKNIAQILKNLFTRENGAYLA